RRFSDATVENSPPDLPEPEREEFDRVELDRDVFDFAADDDPERRNRGSWAMAFPASTTAIKQANSVLADGKEVSHRRDP
ncbi:MAG: hypothetical protein AAF989_10135, partial [Planctomycetota bacterium]